MSEALKLTPIEDWDAEMDRIGNEFGGYTSVFKEVVFPVDHAVGARVYVQVVAPGLNDLADLKVDGFFEFLERRARPSTNEGVAVLLRNCADALDVLNEANIPGSELRDETEELIGQIAAALSQLKDAPDE